MSGKVVDHKESGVRFAISEKNFDDRVHSFVRDLKPGETILGFQPKPKGSLVEDDATSLELDIPETPDPKDVTKTTPHLEAPKPSAPDSK
jgi:hypothetical protein